jgi:uncharacterized protein with GYD domain
MIRDQKNLFQFQALHNALINRVSLQQRPTGGCSQAQRSGERAKKVGVEIKQIYLTSGEHDILVIAEAPLGDHVTKFALALGSLGNVRSCTSRAWTEAERTKLISELP